MSKTNILNLTSVLLAAAVFFTVWIPSTRIFLTDARFGNVAVVALSFVLCALSYLSFKKNKSKINLIPFLVGLSPLLFVAIIVVMLLLRVSLIP